MKRPNRSADSHRTAPERCGVKVLVFTYFAVTAVLLVSLVLMLTVPLFAEPVQARRLALTLCHSSFRLAVLGAVSGLVTDIAAKGMRQ